MAVRPGGDRSEVSNDEAGIAALVAQMQQLNPVGLVLEASGGLELPLVAALAAASLPVVVVNPRQVRDFAKATGRLAKTDSLDAAVLAHFAEAVRPPLRPLRDAETQVLNSLVARRQQVMTMLVAERNRLFQCRYGRPAQYRGPHRLAQAGTGRPGTKACARPSARGPCGGRRTTCCAACPVSETRSLLPFWHTSPNWELSTADRSLPWWAWLPSIGTAVPCWANAPSGVDGPGFAQPSTWGDGSQPFQPGHKGLLPASAVCRQAEKAGSDRLHAQAAHNPQLHAQVRLVLEPSGHEVLHPFPLTFKTVA